MSVYSGEFLGFQLGDIHSSQLNIIRTSSNNRYSENMTPTFTDTTAQVPGGDGTYYWNTFYTQQPFTIDFAFDDLHDEDIRRLKQTFSFKGIKELVFDEFPYKKYMVKCSAPPVLKYIPFNDMETRVYKGEGSVNLIAYYPYGISTEEIISNNSKKSNEYLINNTGDIPTPFKIIFPIAASNMELQLKKGDIVENTLKLTGLSSLNSNDEYYCIDMRTHLIEGLDGSFKKTGFLYNRYVESGDFFEAPVGIYTLHCTELWAQIKYNYLYY